MERKEKQQQLEDLSYRDVLTGLYNRNKYINIVESYDGKNLHNVGVAYIDLNGLKKMNDMYGHEAGDDLIRRAAFAIEAVFSGRAFRVGGDEFVIAQDEVEKAEFLKKIEQIRKEMADRKVSASIGVLWKENQDDMVNMLKQADDIMYDVKKGYHLKEKQRIKSERDNQ